MADKMVDVDIMVDVMVDVMVDIMPFQRYTAWVVPQLSPPAVSYPHASTRSYARTPITTINTSK